MARPALNPGEATVGILVRLPESDRDHLNDAADEQRISTGELVRRTLAPIIRKQRKENKR